MEIGIHQEISVVSDIETQQAYRVQGEVRPFKFEVDVFFTITPTDRALSESFLIARRDTIFEQTFDTPQAGCNNP